jgi:hypothetical protein
MGNRCHPLFVQPEQKSTSMKTKYAITPWLALAALTSLTLQPLPSLAQATAFTYQGRLLDNGTNFTGTGQFEFAVVTSTNANHQATATADAPSGGYIIGYNVVSGGSGYTNAPVVTVSGGIGAGAAAIAHVSGGVVTSITVYNGNFGNGNYTSAPMVTVAPPPPNFSYTTFWSNDGTSITGSQPTSAVGVAVANGLFTVALGDTTVANMTAISAALFTQPNLQLRIWFNDGVNGFAALSPVQNLTPVPYSDFATTANSLSGTISSSNIAGTYGSVVTLSNANNSFSGNGAGLTSVNAVTLNGIGASGFWETTGNSGTTPGANFVGTADNQPLELHVNGARALRLEPDVSGNGAPNVIGGSPCNVVDAGMVGAFIGGGGVTNLRSTGVAYTNRISSNFSIIGGGLGNSIQSGSDSSTIAGGGSGNVIQGNAGDSTISGGAGNTIQGAGSPGAGFGSTIGGGLGNTTSSNSFYATIPGGVDCIAGNFAFAAGSHAIATNQGAFVWGDSWNYNFNSINNNEFAIRATGGFRLVSGIVAGGSPGAGVTLGQGSSSWATISDKNMKKDFVSLDCEEVLKKLATIPVEEWRYKWEAETNTLNIGPMAQDFKAAFYPGRDDKSITTLEFDGVELAAIKGLNQKVDEQTKAKDAAIQQLQETVAQLKDLVSKLAANQKQN